MLKELWLLKTVSYQKYINSTVASKKYSEVNMKKNDQKESTIR